MNETISPAENDPAVQIETMDAPEVNAALDGIVLATFGSQLMKTYRTVEEMALMSNGPTWTGSPVKTADDGDTGGGGSKD